MMLFLLTLLYLVHLLFSGFLLLRLVDRRGEMRPAEQWLPLSFGLGVGLQAFVYTASMVVLGVLSPLLLGGMVILLLGLNVVLHRRLDLLEHFGGFDFMKGPAVAAARGVYWGGVALACFCLVILYYNAMDYPMASYDGRAIWNYKAKILFEERTVFTGAFQDPYRVHYHREYPLLVPIAQFSFYAFIGQVDEDQVRFFFTSIMLFFGLLVYGALRERAGRGVALLMALLFMAAPFREYWVVRDGGAINSGEADFPLSFLAASAAICWWRWWSHGRRGDWILAALFTGFALMTKKECLVVFVLLGGVNGLAWLLTGGPQRAKRLGTLAAATVASLLVASPWFLLSPHLPNHYDEDYVAMFRMEVFQHAWKRLSVIGPIFLNDVREWEKWNYFWYSYPLVLLWGLGSAARSRRFPFFEALVVLWMAAYTVVYMLSPLNLVFHLNTSLRRLLAHMYPLVILQTGFVVGQALNYLSNNREKN